MTLCHGPSPSQETSVLHVASLRCCHAAFTAAYHSPAACANVGPALGPDTLSSGCRDLERLHWRCSPAGFSGLFPQISFSSTKSAPSDQSCWAPVTAAPCPPSLCPSSSTPAPTAPARACSASCLPLQIPTLKTLSQAEGRHNTLEVEELRVI